MHVSLRFFAVYALLPLDIPADETYSLSLILTSVLFPTRSCQLYFHNIDQKKHKHIQYSCNLIRFKIRNLIDFAFKRLQTLICKYCHIILHDS